LTKKDLSREIKLVHTSVIVFKLGTHPNKGCILTDGKSVYCRALNANLWVPDCGKTLVTSYTKMQFV